MLLALIVTSLSLLFIWTNWRMLRRRSALPPGPFPWPLVGNLMQMDSGKPHLTMQKWSKIYGPVFTVWLGHRPMIIIADYETMKQALSKDQLVNRPPFFAFEYLSKGNFGIFMSIGDAWKEQRRFSLHVLRNFGLGRNVMEEKILVEAKRLVASIREDMGTRDEVASDLTMPFNLCVGSIIGSLIFGHSFEKGDQRLQLLKETLDKSSELLGSPRLLILDSLPWLRHLPLFGHFGLDDLSKVNNIIHGFLAEELEDHKRELKQNENNDEEPKDFSAAYLKELNRRQREGEDTSHFSEWQLTCIAADLWIAGMQSMVITLRWAILAMVKYPNIQQKVHREIDSVLGRERLPSMSDRLRMPYVVATINEVQRWGNILPINFAHTSETDFQLNGYTIPKGVPVIPQISLLAIDEKNFPHPEQFLPERFLEDGGDKLSNVDKFSPFSMGKRNCMGEGFARTQLFLIFVHLLQKFRFSIPPGQDEPTAEPVTGFALVPQDFECLITLR